MVGKLIRTGAPRLGIVGAIADGIFVAVTDGELRVIFSVVIVGTFFNAGATIEGLSGAVHDGAIRAVADSITGGFSTGICGATNVGLFAVSLSSRRVLAGL
jgi:hypothetical protein